MNQYYENQFNMLKQNIIHQLSDFDTIIDTFYATQDVQVQVKNIKGLSFNIQFMMQEIIEEINRSQDTMLQDKITLEVKKNDLKHDILNFDKIIKTVKELVSDTNYLSLQFEIQRFCTKLIDYRTLLIWTYFLSNDVKKDIVNTFAPIIYNRIHKRLCTKTLNNISESVIDYLCL